MPLQRRSRYGLLVALVLLGAISPIASTGAAPALDIEGNTYTSPSFGYTISWDDSWSVTNEGSENGLDFLFLANGVTAASFLGFDFPLAQDSCLPFLTEGLGANGGLTDLEEIVGADGAPIAGTKGGLAYAALSGTSAQADGTAVDRAVFLYCLPILQGHSVLGTTAFMPRERFDDQLPAILALLDDVALRGTVAPETGPDAVDRPGEPAPVFVSGRWRVAIAGAARDDEIPIANLEAKDGKDWLVVVADVTNWSDREARLSDGDLTLVFPDDERRFAFAPNSSRAVARELGLEVRDLETRGPIKAGETVRIALVFLIPDDRTGPVLHGKPGTVGLPLDTGHGAKILDDLPAPAEPPPLWEVSVVGVLDGETVELQVAGADAPMLAHLIGVGGPAEGSCAHDGLISSLTALMTDAPMVLTTLWIERDPTVAGGEIEEVYLWVEGDAGTRVLFNEEAVAVGNAEPGDLDPDARFAAWIGEAGRTAETGEGCGAEAANAWLDIV